MKTIVVRYEVKPDRANENQKLVEQVFAELHELDLTGFGYAAFRLEDGVTFVHIVREVAESEPALSEVPAFKFFVEGIVERCAQPPVAMQATVVGSHRFFAD